MKNSTITDFEKDLYKNWNNIKFLEQHGRNNLIFISNKIKKTSSDGPYISVDIADFISEIIKGNNYSLGEINERIKIAIWHIKKGNVEDVFNILQNRLKL